MKWICCLLLVLLSLGAAPARRITDDKGDTLAVIVPHDMALVHMPQFADDVATQLAKMGDAIKINIVARDLAAAADARQLVRNAFASGARPAVSVVLGAVPNEMPIAVDVVLATKRQHTGSRVYIAGQAEKGATPAEATARTLASLTETLAFVGCKPADVVQAKSFLTPMSARHEILLEFDKVFGERKISLPFVQWKSDLPIEIEVIAQGPPPPPDAPAIEYLTPPGKQASPVFARVARVNRGDLIYIGDLYAAKPGGGEEQVLSIYAQLQNILKRTNSDLRHLVKATYYVSDEDASKQLNLLRPKFYNRARPPAASKAMVPAVGMAARSISIDMIAVTIRP